MAGFVKLTLDEIVKKRADAGTEWVEASTIHHRLDKGCDAKLKQIMHNIRTTQSPPPGKKNWLRDDLRDFAQASEEWSKYLDDLNDAYSAMLDAINKREAWGNAFEARRSQMAHDREMAKSS